MHTLFLHLTRYYRDYFLSVHKCTSFDKHSCNYYRSRSIAPAATVAPAHLHGAKTSIYRMDYCWPNYGTFSPLPPNQQASIHDECTYASASRVNNSPHKMTRCSMGRPAGRPRHSVVPNSALDIKLRKNRESAMRTRQKQQTRKKLLEANLRDQKQQHAQLKSELRALQRERQELQEALGQPVEAQVV